jgi:hypothetical protein
LQGDGAADARAVLLRCQAMMAWGLATWVDSWKSCGVRAGRMCMCSLVLAVQHVLQPTCCYHICRNSSVGLHSCSLPNLSNLYCSTCMCACRAWRWCLSVPTLIRLASGGPHHPPQSARTRTITRSISDHLPGLWLA